MRTSLIVFIFCYLCSCSDAARETSSTLSELPNQDLATLNSSNAELFSNMTLGLQSGVAKEVMDTLLPNFNTLVNTTTPCVDSGSLTINATNNNRLTLSFQNCVNIPGVAIDGTLILLGSNYNQIYGTFSSSQYTFSIDEITSAKTTNYSGTLEQNIDYNLGLRTIVSNLVVNDTNAEIVYSHENYQIVTNLIDNNDPRQWTSLEVNGRINHSQYGTVSVSTQSPFTYVSSSNGFPNGGGPVRVQGFGNSYMLVEPVNGTSFQFQLDYEGDNVFDYIGNGTWQYIN